MHDHGYAEPEVNAAWKQLGARPLRDLVEKHLRDTATAALLDRREIKRGSITVAESRLALVAERLIAASDHQGS